MARLIFEAENVVRDPSPLPRFAKQSRGSYQCRACGLEFNAAGTFDAHRHGPYVARGCLDLATLLANDYRRDERGVISGPPLDHDPWAQPA